MRYKTLFRLLLKLLGVWFAVDGGLAAVNSVGQLISMFGASGFPGASLWMYSFFAVSSFGKLGVGLYLFFGGAWIVNLAIPSNRPYCPQCGYDLSETRGAVCVECGVALPDEVVAAMSRGTTRALDDERAVTDGTPPREAADDLEERRTAAGAVPPHETINET